MRTINRNHSGATVRFINEDYRKLENSIGKVIFEPLLSRNQVTKI